MRTCCPTCGSRYATWTPARIIEAAQTWHRTHGTAPTCDDWTVASPANPNRKTVYRHFKSWSALCAAAGIVSRKDAREAWTKDAVIQAIFEWRVRHGRLPKSGEWEVATADHPTRHRVRVLFGSWNAGIVAAQYEPRRKHRTIVGYQRQAGAVTRLAA